jgi:protein SCO1/2
MKRIVAIAVAGVIAAGGFAGALALSVRGGPASYRGSEPPGTIRLPEFALRTFDGRAVRSDELRGRVVLVTFLDSQCTEACPILASQIARALDRLGADERRDVAAVAISTDPAEDTPRSVRAFLEKQNALGKLLYLTGPGAELRAAWKRFQILSSEESGEDTLHSAPLRVYDRDLVWASTLHVGVDLTPENVVHDVRLALREDRP